MDALRFDNRVAIVTGAGSGLGRQYALLLGRRGASVIVNDLGGDIHGSGASSRAADIVVEEIKQSGGKAVANYNSVEDGESIVRTALENFGRVDIVINNAGILRDKSFARIGDEDWDIIHRVHLRGSFLVTRAAWPHMRKQNYGRIIMTSSAAGVFGNFGQANYSAAKLGLLGLSNTLAIEGAKYNIHCNTIVPTAGSRLTETVMPPDIVESLKPEFIAPVVVYLCHESCEDNGRAIQSGGSWVSRLRWEETEGAVLRSHKNDIVTLEKVRDNWEKINDFTNSRRTETIQESTNRVLEAVQEASSNSADSSRTPDRLDGWIGFNLPPLKFQYSSRDIALYALGVGVSVEDESGLKFLFEGHQDFTALPTFGIIVCQQAVMGGVVSNINSIDPTRILHGEHYMELKAPLPISATLTSKVSIAEVLDKGKGALIVLDAHTTDENGQEIAFNQFVTYAGGAGGFGGRRNSDKIKAVEEIPHRQPDATSEQQMSTDQAALYRLSGDYNPLHIDPAFATMGGLPRPIVHGLCSLGFAVRHVMEKFANNDVSLFDSVKVRFSRPVIPGQTLVTQMWKSDKVENRIIMRCLVKETGETCLSGAYVDLKSGATQEDNVTVETDSLRSTAIMEEISRRVAQNPQLAKKVNAVFSWKIRTPDGSIADWTMDLRAGEVYRGDSKRTAAECVIEIAEDDLVAMTMGKLNAQKAYMQGKLKVKGNIMLSQKLSTILSNQTKL